MTVCMASAAVVFPEPLAPENKLTGPRSNSLSGTLPQFTNTNFLRNTLFPVAVRRSDPAPLCHRARRLDSIHADEVDNHGMDAQPRLALLQLLIRTIVDQAQLPQALKNPAPFRRFFRQRAV